MLGGKGGRTAGSGALDVKGDNWMWNNALAGDLVECKDQKTWHVHDWIDRAREQAGPHRWWILARRPTHGYRAVVFGDFYDWLQLLALGQEASEARAEVRRLRELCEMHGVLSESPDS